MKLIRKHPVAEKRIVSVRSIKREDLARLEGPRRKIGMPKKLRNSHHNIARYAAIGLNNKQIGERVGMSRERVGQLLKVPAMEELVANYRERVDEAFIDGIEAYLELATSNMIAAERHIADRIAELDEDDELLPINDALKISRDAADRFGYGKKSTNVNVNVDFAAKLEDAIKRSDKVSQKHIPSRARAVGGAGPVINGSATLEEEGVPVLPSSSTLRRI